MKRKLLSWLVVLCVGISFCFPAYGTQTQTESVEAGIATRIEEIVYVAFSDLPGQYEIGNAETIYNADTPSISYMIPVFCNQECAGMVEVDLDGNVTATDNTELYANIMDLESNEYLLFATGGIIYAGLPGETVEIYDTGFVLPQNDTYTSLSYEGKVGVAEEYINTIELAFDISAVTDATVMPCILDPEIALFARPPIFTETETCAITDFVPQNNFSICWAACVATIVNFRNNDNLTAEEVAIAMGHHNYDNENYHGATADVTASALNLYGLNYTNSSAKLTWTSLKNNIETNRPFIIGIQTTINGETAGHMLTGYGYSCHVGDGETYADSRLVTVWDPNGHQTTIQYNATSFQLDLYSYSWNWIVTIYD